MAFTSDPQSVADLLPPPELDDVRAFLLAYVSVPQNKVSSWLSGDVLRTMWEIEAILIQDLVGHSLSGDPDDPTIIGLAEGGYPDRAAGDSLERLARGWFGVDIGTAQVAMQSVVLACDAGHGPYTSAQVAAVLGVSSDGFLYRVTAGAGTLSSGGTITVTMTADSPGLATGLVAALSGIGGLAGVTVQSAAILTFGSNGEDDASIRAEMDSRFDDFEVPENDRLVLWALAAAPAPLITRWRRDADTVYPGGVLFTLADADGPVAAGTVNDVNAAFDDLSPITDSNTAQNSSTHAIGASGTVKVAAALLSRAQAQADAAWAAAMSGAQIGGKFFVQTLREIVGAAIRADPGSNFTGWALTGAGPDGNVALGSDEVPVASGTLTAQLTWVAT